MNNTVISDDSEIGEFTYIGFNCFLTKATVGRYCSIANNVSIGMGEHLIDEVSTSSLFYNNAYETLTLKHCTIGNDVWIGVNAVIRRGVVIGNGAIIGANSFVNKDVPAYSIVGGIPAKKLKSRFTCDVIDKIEQSKWWLHDLEEAKQIIEKLKIND
ncbi:CatB-related O-acetyltransferase [uncultured Pedobacter sp.]|uniref:CatB-related O-acetyltransferase n=1 Tax=uncultured Pedobacter sp. TaxID=246139 RepID=UPI0025ED36D9|nr:CatB-related O-acetyltransferase [uncultured Pedobacter sp.]